MMEFIDIKSYRDLRVWNLAVTLASEVYQLSRRLPEQEAHLVESLRRDSVALATTIAKGFTIGSSEAFLEHIGEARGALASVETQLLLAKQNELATETSIDHALARVGQIGVNLRGLQKALQRRLAH